MKWFYHYKAHGSVDAVAGPFETEAQCSTARDLHRDQKPEDQCQAPVKKPDDYQHVFYNRSNP